MLKEIQQHEHADGRWALDEELGPTAGQYWPLAAVRNHRVRVMLEQELHERHAACGGCVMERRTAILFLNCVRRRPELSMGRRAGQGEGRGKCKGT